MSRPRTARSLLALGLAALMLGGAVACNGGDEEDAPGVDKVTFVTTFGTFGREAAAYVAGAKGFFAEAGIEVEIQPGRAGDYNMQLIRSQSAEFASVDYAGAVMRAANGEADDAVMVAALNHKALLAMMARPDGPIKTARDLEGKTLGVPTGGVAGSLFPGYAELAGIDISKVTVKEMGPELLIPTLEAGRVDVIGQFVVGAPAVAAAIGAQPVILPYSEYVTDLYGNALITRRDLLEADPDLVRRFTEALLKGLRYAVDHPEESAEILRAKVDTTVPAVAAAELRLLGPYVDPSGDLGRFNASLVARGVATLRALGLLGESVLPETFIDFSVMGEVR